MPNGIRRYSIILFLILSITSCNKAPVKLIQFDFSKLSDMQLIQGIQQVRMKRIDGVLNITSPFNSIPDPDKVNTWFEKLSSIEITKHDKQGTKANLKVAAALFFKSIL